MNRHRLLFTLAVIFQVVILAAVPARKIYTLSTGKTVMLKIRPVDPYSMLSGYYVSLGYEIGDLHRYPASSYPGGEKTVYAIVEKDAEGTWHPVALSTVLPDNLPENRLAIRGQYMHSWIDYGIEEFFIPEEKRSEIEQGLRSDLNKVRVEVKVDSRGNAALVRLLIGDRIYSD